MRLVSSWQSLVIAGLTLLAACAPGEHPTTPDQPGSMVSTPQAAVAGSGTILLEEAFEDTAFASRGWYDNTNLLTTTAQHVAGSTRALEVRFLPGAMTPTLGGSARHLFPATPTLYVSYWVKYSPNWVGSGRAYHPHEFLVLSDQDGDWDGPSNNWLTAYIEHNYQNGGIPRLALQDNKTINTTMGALPLNLIGVTENRSIGGCNGVSEPNVVATCFNMPPWYNDKEFIAPQVAFQPSAGPGYKGDWNHVEAYFQLNSVVGGVAQTDGVAQYWFNGAPILDRHDVVFRTGLRPTIQFHQFLIAPYIGDGSPVDQSMWVDNLTLATSRSTSAPSDSLVASLTVAPASASLSVGGTAQLTATSRDASGNVLTGQPVTWVSSSPAVATIGSNGLVTGVVAGTATISATTGSKTATAAITVTATVTNPGTVSNLAVAGVTNNSVTLSFTEVNDGTGQPARYDIRWAAGTFSWASAKSVTQGTCAVPVGGTAIGAARTCTVLGLNPSTTYRFQLVPFRGTLNVNAVFGSLSNVATGATASATLVPVATVTLSPGSVNLAPGATQRLTATLNDASGNVLTGRTVTWSSSNPAVATVGGGGSVAGVAVGTAIITATSEGKSGTAAITVVAAAPAPVATVTLSPASASLAVGATQQVAAVLKDASGNTLTGRTVTWTSSAPLVATVGGSGSVAGVAVGTATITATSEGKSGTAAITVIAPAPAPVATVTLSPASASLEVGATQQVAAVLKDASGNTLTGRTVTWASSAPLVASVSSSGLVTGLLAGAATITATSEGKSGTASVTVTIVAPPPPPPPPPPAPVATVTVSPASASLTIGATRQLSATLKDASGATLSGRTVTWMSSSPAVATVGSNGLVTGVVAGTATVTATSEGKSGSATVTVTATTTNPGTVTTLAVASVTTSSVTLSFTEVNDGTGQAASYDIRWAAGTTLSWATAREVTQGTCKTPLTGTAIGTARTCTVLGLVPSTAYRFQLVAYRGTLNVNAVFGALSNVAGGTTGTSTAPVASVSISPNPVSQSVGTTQQFTATLKDATGSVLTGRAVTWSSSNATIASITGTGLETSLVVGSASITATSEGQSGSAAVTVTVLPPPPPPTSGTWANEPAGWRTITDYAFDDVIPTGGDVGIAAGWSVVNAAGRIARVSDATAAISPSNVARINYPAGFGAGSEPGTLYYPHSGTKDHYVGYEFKLSNPYSNNAVGTKQWYPYSTTANYFMLYASDGKMWMYVQADGSHGGAYNLSGNVSNPTITLGVWHKLEMMQRYPTSSTSNDGIFRWWIDGVLCGNYTNIGWSTTSTYQELRFAPTWGGTSGSVAFDTYFQVDHVHISQP